jgi:hypothetical protein
MPDVSEDQEEKKGEVNIYVEGLFYGSEKELAERIAEIVTENVENNEIRLVASHARALTS